MTNPNEFENPSTDRTDATPSGCGAHVLQHRTTSHLLRSQ